MSAGSLVALLLLVGGTLAFETINDQRRAGLQKRLPEETMDTYELLNSKMYPVESHPIYTEDGYILTAYRIPAGKYQSGVGVEGKPVVFLQHGLLCNSDDWLLNRENQSLAYILADNGYDVWLGNFRGTRYSKRHTVMKPKEDRFWDFSWDEYAKFDLPAMVNYILAKTNQPNLAYIGHSEGTMTNFAHMSEDPVYASKINKFFALGPVTTVANIKGAMRLITKFMDKTEWLINMLGPGEFLPKTIVLDFLAKTICGSSHTNPLCSSLLFLMFGPDSDQLDPDRLAVYMVHHTSAETSTKNVLHFAQMVDSEKFCKYDYKSNRKNNQHYGQTTPPDYDVSKVTTPTYIFWSPSDWLADQTDVELLAYRLRPETLKGYYRYEGYNHMDFLWGMRAAPEIYTKILQLLKEP